VVQDARVRVPDVRVRGHPLARREVLGRPLARVVVQGVRLRKADVPADRATQHSTFASCAGWMRKK